MVGIGSGGATWTGAGLSRSLSCSCAGVGGMCSGEGCLGETDGVTYSGDRRFASRVVSCASAAGIAEWGMW